MTGEPASSGSEALWAIVITLGILILGSFGVYYFLAPPPEISLQEAADRRMQEKNDIVTAQLTAEQEASVNAACGEGLSGRLCRLHQGSCDTALGAYFCYTEGRDTGD